MRTIDESFQGMLNRRYGVDFDNLKLSKSIFEALDDYKYCEGLDETLNEETKDPTPTAYSNSSAADERAAALNAQNAKITKNVATAQAQKNSYGKTNYNNLASASGESGDYKTSNNKLPNNLKMGSTGNDVAALQTTLKNAGYDIGSTGADGKFGAKTLAALALYLADRGLTADGVYGEQTHQAVTNSNAAQNKVADQKANTAAMKNSAATARALALATLRTNKEQADTANEIRQASIANALQATVDRAKQNAVNKFNAAQTAKQLTDTANEIRQASVANAQLAKVDAAMLKSRDQLAAKLNAPANAATARAQALSTQRTNIDLANTANEIRQASAANAQQATVDRAKQNAVNKFNAALAAKKSYGMGGTDESLNENDTVVNNTPVTNNSGTVTVPGTDTTNTTNTTNTTDTANTTNITNTTSTTNSSDFNVDSGKQSTANSKSSITAMGDYFQNIAGKNSGLITNLLGGISGGLSGALKSGSFDALSKSMSDSGTKVALTGKNMFDGIGPKTTTTESLNEDTNARAWWISGNTSKANYGSTEPLMGLLVVAKDEESAKKLAQDRYFVTNFDNVQEANIENWQKIVDWCKANHIEIVHTNTFESLNEAGYVTAGDAITSMQKGETTYNKPAEADTGVNRMFKALNTPIGGAKSDSTTGTTSTASTALKDTKLGSVLSTKLTATGTADPTTLADRTGANTPVTLSGTQPAGTGTKTYNTVTAVTPTLYQQKNGNVSLINTAGSQSYSQADLLAAANRANIDSAETETTPKTSVKTDLWGTKISGGNYTTVGKMNANSNSALGTSVNGTLKLGSEGEAVSALQTQLGMDATGTFDKATQDRLKEWQTAHGITSDGIYGRQTNAAMMNQNWTYSNPANWGTTTVTTSTTGNNTTGLVDASTGDDIASKSAAKAKIINNIVGNKANAAAAKSSGGAAGMARANATANTTGSKAGTKTVAIQNNYIPDSQRFGSSLSITNAQMDAAKTGYTPSSYSTGTYTNVDVTPGYEKSRNKDTLKDYIQAYSSLSGDDYSNVDLSDDATYAYWLNKMQDDSEYDSSKALADLDFYKAYL